MWLNVVILIACGIGILAVVIKLITGYKSATGSPWDRIIASASQSATMLWNYIVAAGGLAVVWATEASQFFDMPQVTDFINKHLSPEGVGTAMTIIAIVGIIARLRTLKKT